jgi:hypothetical protein
MKIKDRKIIGIKATKVPYRWGIEVTNNMLLLLDKHYPKYTLEGISFDDLEDDGYDEDNEVMLKSGVIVFYLTRDVELKDYLQGRKNVSLSNLSMIDVEIEGQYDCDYAVYGVSKTLDGVYDNEI